MAENFIFKALFISLAVHTAVLCAAYFGRINDPQYKAIKQNRIEISYRPLHRRSPDIREYPIRPAQRLDLSSDPKFLTEDGTIPVSVVKDKPMLPFGMSYERKPELMHSMELSRRISIMPITSAKINNPAYAAYNEIVRDRIKEKVYANYDKLEMGTVYLTFLIDNHGVLKEVRIVPERTNASEHLQATALQTLEEASPFPPFLRGMNLSEYSLNIEIQYQVSE